MSVTVKDTAAHSVIKQIIRHNFEKDYKISDKEFVLICVAFDKANGSWLALMDGDIDQVFLMISIIENLINLKNLSKAVKW